MAPKQNAQGGQGCRAVVDVEVRFHALQLSFQLAADLPLGRLREQLAMVTGIGAEELLLGGPLSSAGDDELLREYAEESRLVVLIENEAEEAEEEEARERVDLDDLFPADAEEQAGEAPPSGKEFAEAWARAWDAEPSEEELPYDVYYSETGQPISAAEANVGGAPAELAGLERKRELEEQTKLDEAIALSLMQESAGAFEFDAPLAAAPPPETSSPQVMASAPQLAAGEPQLSLSDLEELLCQIEVGEAFLKSYEAQYGEQHPRFALGSVRKAMRTAQASGRPLLLYLHYPDHVHTLPFCCGTLAGSGTSAFFDDHYVVWLGCVGAELEDFFREALQVKEYPLMVVMGSLTGSDSMRVLKVMQGLLGPDELLIDAMQVLDRFKPLMEPVKTSLRQRSEAEILREQQKVEFERALEKDKRQEEQAEQARLAKLAVERQLQAEASAGELLVQAARARLPPEPAEDAEGVASIKVLLPNRTELHRRFLSSDKVQALYDFVTVDAAAEVGQKSFVLMLSHPRKALSEKEKTLEEVNLSGRAVVRLQYE